MGQVGDGRRAISQSLRVADRADPVLARRPGGGRRAVAYSTAWRGRCYRADAGDFFLALAPAALGWFCCRYWRFAVRLRCVIANYFIPSFPSITCAR